MSPRSKREYREAVYLRYKKARRHEKTAILDEFCTTCGCHRKRDIRVLRRFKRFTKPKPKRRGKPSIYQNEATINPLKEIWLAVNLPCSKRLKVMLPIWLPGYVELFGKLSCQRCPVKDLHMIASDFAADRTRHRYHLQCPRSSFRFES